MQTENAAVGDILSAMHQAYYALYAVLIRNGAVERGDVAELLRAPGTGTSVGPEAAAWLLGMADSLDNIDAGGSARFQVIDGGKADDT